MFGGFAPLPIRLGGSGATGWSAAQHARAAADTAAVSRSAPLASLTVDIASTTVTSYHGRNGSGLGSAPTPQALTTGRIRLYWEITYPSEQFSDGQAVSYPWAMRSGVLSGHYNGAPVIATIRPLSGTNIMGPYVMEVETRKWDGAAWTLSDEMFSLRVFGDWGPESRIGDYDGAPDKLDCATEIEPYAWLWYQEYEAMLGDAFTRNRTGMVHAKKLTLARFEAGKTRAWERARANSLPNTADDCLGQWVQVLGVPVRASDQKWQIRQRCAAKFQGAIGPTQQNVDDSLSKLLGPLFVQTIRPIGVDLDTPPPLTFWPGVNPGPPAMSLGGGAWSSERAHVVVIVAKPPSSQLGEFLYQTNVVLFQQLDRLLPAKCTFNWTTSVQGFLLDGAPHADGSFSQLDFDGLTPS